MTNWVLRLVGVLLMATALGLALSRAPDRPVQTLVARWAPAPSDFIEVGGQVVHLRDEGPRDDPLPLVLIHGTSASLHTWEGWVKALKGQRRVITFDLPGFGLTGPFAGRYTPDDYRGDTYARFVVDLLDTLELPRVALGGNSLGGEVAWRTAVLAPERVASLVLVDALGPAFTPEDMPLGFMIARVPVLNRVSEWVLPRSLVAQGLASVYGDPARVSSELVDRYFELALREGNRRALAMRMQHLVVGEGFDKVGALAQPTLILWGGRDRLIPPAVGRQFNQRIAGSQFVVFDTLGHVPHEEDPARSVVPVKAFLGLK
ncbi:MAG: alpha/beta hydrolase [Leptothrix sp. (in: Bacteria)]|nr:alpha/beta hydrolase [Leptothrix sp. (in: b-proteobacteria)]